MAKTATVTVSVKDFEEFRELYEMAAQLAAALAGQVDISDHDPIERLDEIRGASYRALEKWRKNYKQPEAAG